MTKENLKALVNGQRKAIETDIAWAQHEIMLLSPYAVALKDKKASAFINHRLVELSEDMKHNRILLSAI